MPSTFDATKINLDALRRKRTKLDAAIAEAEAKQREAAAYEAAWQRAIYLVGHSVLDAAPHMDLVSILVSAVKAVPDDAEPSEVAAWALVRDVYKGTLGNIEEPVPAAALPGEEHRVVG